MRRVEYVIREKYVICPLLPLGLQRPTIEKREKNGFGTYRWAGLYGTVSYSTVTAVIPERTRFV